MVYMMRKSDDCGPAALSEATGIPYEKVIENWPGGWLSSDRGRIGIPNDTPYDHATFLESQNIPFEFVCYDEIVSDQCLHGKTIILLHLQNFGDKKTFWQKIKDYFYPTFNKHWVVLHSVSVERNTISLYWGNGEIKTYTLEHFEKLFKGAWPMCAYIVGYGSSGPDFLTRMIAKLTGRWL